MSGWLRGSVGTWCFPSIVSASILSNPSSDKIVLVVNRRKHISGSCTEGDKGNIDRATE